MHKILSLQFPSIFLENGASRLTMPFGDALLYTEPKVSLSTPPRKNQDLVFCIPHFDRIGVVDGISAAQKHVYPFLDAFSHILETTQDISDIETKTQTYCQQQNVGMGIACTAMATFSPYVEDPDLSQPPAPKKIEFPHNRNLTKREKRLFNQFIKGCLEEPMSKLDPQQLGFPLFFNKSHNFQKQLRKHCKTIQNCLDILTILGLLQKNQ